MAETNEGGQPERRSSGGGSNPFTRKLGPLPTWAWMGIGLGLALAWANFRKGKQAAAASTTTDTTGDQTAGQTPPIIIQNYPGEGTPGPAGPAGPAGPQGPTGSTGAPGGTTTPPPVVTPPKPQTTTKPKAPIAYKVKPGDSLSKIAAKYHTTWQALWNFNIGPSSPHSKQAIATLKQRGPNLLYSNETIYIPQ